MSEQKTHAEIIAEMRFHGQLNIDAEKDKPEYGILTVEGRITQNYAAELDAAHKREVEDAERRGNHAATKAICKTIEKVGPLYDAESVGNAAKLREALVCLRDAARKFHHQILNSKYNGILDKYTCEKQGFSAALEVVGAIVKANYAISAPARNCDMGTPEEQKSRYDTYCFNHRTMEKCCGDCPIKNAPSCELAWAQMPYESEGAI